jgi:hypothetical protein
MKITRNILIIVAVLFGLLTIFAGTRVLLGSNPGYVVFRPLLIYNTSMGIAYVAAGVIAWRNIKQGMYMASAIFVLNLIVLIAIFFLYTEGGSIAVESLRAMSLRTGVWFALYAGFWWLCRRNKFVDSRPDA